MQEAGKIFVAITESDEIGVESYDPGMLSDWLKKALTGAGKSQSELARHLTAALGRSIDRAAVNKMVSGKRAISADELLEASRFLSTPTPQDFQKLVKLAGYVGAGQEVYQFDDDGAGFVEAPPSAEDGTEAVEVRGESMLPLYEDGTILYYSRQLPPENMVGRRAVVKLADDRILVKAVRRGAEKGLFTLVSLNAPDIEDVALQWAAPIDWIKPR
jgi:phage repressor protein C with HTH and peptisase S24 domain